MKTSFSFGPPSPWLRLPACVFTALTLASCHDPKSAGAEPPQPETNIVLFPVLHPDTPATAKATPAAASPKPYTLTPSTPLPEPNSPAGRALIEAVQLERQGLHDAALEKLNTILQDDPKNINALVERGTIHSTLKQWDQARQDNETILQLDDKNTVAKFNLAEIQFRQKAYAEARPGFEALESDFNLGDFASYKVFLCDLLGGQADAAQKEFDAFNKAGSNPSYYFGNLAWCLVHNQPKEASNWLQSGKRIYSREKVYYYTYSLLELGYLPIPVDQLDH